MTRHTTRPFLVAVAALCATAPAFAQSVSLPPSGDNQKSSITQHLGLATVSVE